MFELLGDGGEVLDFFFKVRQHTFLRQSVRSYRGWLGGLKHQGILLARSGLVVQSGHGAGCEHNCIYFTCKTTVPLPQRQIEEAPELGKPA